MIVVEFVVAVVIVVVILLLVFLQLALVPIVNSNSRAGTTNSFYYLPGSEQVSHTESARWTIMTKNPICRLSS